MTHPARHETSCESFPRKGREPRPSAAQTASGLALLSLFLLPAIVPAQDAAAPEGRETAAKSEEHRSETPQGKAAGAAPPTTAVDAEIVEITPQYTAAGRQPAERLGMETPRPALPRPPKGKGSAADLPRPEELDLLDDVEIEALADELKLIPAKALTTTFDSTDFDTNFVNSGGSRFVPADPHAAAGPNHLVNVTNVTLRVHGKGGGAPLVDTSLANFFGALNPLTQTFDPRVVYDAANDRFVVITLEQTDTNNGDAADTSRLLVAVSATADPTGTWRVTSINSRIQIGGLEHWADFPGLAVDAQAVYVTANMFEFQADGGAFGGNRLWIIAKGAGSGGFYDGGLASVSVVDPAPSTSGNLSNTMMPARIFGAPPAGVGTWLTLYSGLTNGTAEFLQILRLDDPLGTPVITRHIVAIGDLEDFPLPPAEPIELPDAPQSGTATLIETNDRRILDAVWRDDDLWLTTTISPKSGDVDQATAYWLRIDTTNLAFPLRVDGGPVGGEDIALGTHTFFPSIAVNSDGEAAISFAASGPGIFPGSYYTFRRPADAAGTVQSSEVLRAGTDFYIRTLGGSRNRWGDYSSTTVDPVNECFWTFNQHAMTRGTLLSGEDGRWRTAAGTFCVCEGDPASLDGDFDDFCDDIDNCPIDANPGQEDGDGDGVGDVCDNCPLDFNPGQEDGDNDGLGDVCETVIFTVTKSAAPSTLPEPSGAATFTVEITNNDTATMTLTSLVDVPFGTLDGRGDCTVGQTIAVGNTYSCSFTENVSGNAGESASDTVTAEVTIGNRTGMASDSASVLFTDVSPTITLQKSAMPTSLPEPGGAVTFTARVDNTGSAEPVDLIALVDDIHGDLNGQGSCSVPQTIQPGNFYECSFIANVNGNAGDVETDTITATARDDDGNQVMANDSASVTLTDVLPTIALTKTAAPTSIPEPSAPVDFTVRVDNTGSAEPVELTALLDDVFGDLNGQGNCAVPQTILPGEFYECVFTGTVSGNPGDTEIDTITATARDDDNGGAGNQVMANDSASVTIFDALPQITVTKTALPAFVVEPGSPVTFIVQVDNDAGEILDLDSLIDDVYGNLHNRGTCSLPQILAGNGSYQCAFTVSITGNPGDVETDTVTASVSDDEGNNAQAMDSATVTIVDAIPAITVTKTALPSSLDEPGGSVDFTVRVDNVGLESLTLLSLIDDLHGDLHTQGDCSLPQTVLAGGNYQCTFSATVNGVAGDSETDTVTATAEDNDGNSVMSAASATVSIVGTDFGDAPAPYPTLLINDGARHVLGARNYLGATADHESDGQPLAAAAGDDGDGQDDEEGVTFPEPLVLGATGTVDVVASEPCVLNAWLDFDVDGGWGEIGDQIFNDVQLSAGLNAGLNFPIPPGATAGTTYARFRCSSQSGLSPTGSAIDGEVEDHEVTLTAPAATQIVVTVEPVSAHLPEPGGTYTFTVNVENVGTEGVTLNSLTDSVYGNLHGQGNCSTPIALAAGVDDTCTFTGTFTGNGGDSQTSTVTASAEDGAMVPATSSDKATVFIDDVAPSFVVLETANPANLPEPGGSVDFTVRVDNTGGEPLTLDALVDDLHGDLAGQGNCTVPQTVAAGAFYECTFSAAFSGAPGDSETDTVTATLSDDEGNAVNGGDSATVTITNVAPAASVTHDAVSSSVPEPGGSVDFTVRIENQSSVEPLELTALIDDVHGDLAGQGTCAVPQTLPIGGSYQCGFTATVNGNAGDSESDTVTATVADDDGSSITPADSATVTITNVAPVIQVVQSAAPTSVPESGGSVTFTVRVDNQSTAEPLELTALIDDVHGDLAGQGTCSVPQTIAIGGSYQCEFMALLSGNAGGSTTDTVTATAGDDDGNQTQSNDSATVSFSDVLPALAVSKNASAPSVPETGGIVTFTVRVDNQSTEAGQLTVLTDDVFGNLAGQGTCAVPQAIAAGTFYECAFSPTTSGEPAVAQTSTASATLADDDGNQAQGNDSATVSFTDVLPMIGVAESASPAIIEEPGGPVNLTVRVSNTGAEAVTLTALTNSIVGNLDNQGSCALPQALGGGANYECTFTAILNVSEGVQEVDTVNATAEDNEGNVAGAQDGAMMTVVPPVSATIFIDGFESGNLSLWSSSAP